MAWAGTFFFFPLLFKMPSPQCILCTMNNLWLSALTGSFSWWWFSRPSDDLPCQPDFWTRPHPSWKAPKMLSALWLNRVSADPIAVHSVFIFFQIAGMNFLIPAGFYFIFFSVSSMNCSCFTKIQLSAPLFPFFFFSSSIEATSDGSAVAFCDLFFCLSRVQQII